jgi:DNA-binding IclR family transcriptional regulator
MTPATAQPARKPVASRIRRQTWRRTASRSSPAAEARERGYAVTTGEVVPGYTGMSAPVYVNGEATASVGLVIPASRAAEVPELALEVIKLAEALSLANG